MLYNKDNQYTLKYVTKDGKEKELDYTPEKDMSVPEIITMLKNKDKDFFKLLKESKFDKVSKKIFNKGKQDGMTKDDADAIAASIGRKKYGKEKFQKMAQKGKKTENDISRDTMENKSINQKADSLIKDYFNHKMDLSDLHDKLEKVFGNKKDAVEYFANNEARLKSSKQEESRKVRFDGGELNVIKDNLTLSEFNDYIQNIENTFSGAITFVSNPENVPLYNDLQRVEVYSDDTNEPSKFVYYTEDYDVVNDETTYTIYGDGDLEESKITTTSGEYDTEEYEKTRSNVKQAFKDFWNNKISGSDLENIKKQSKLSQGELDSIQYDVSRETNKKEETRQYDINDNTKFVSYEPDIEGTYTMSDMKKVYDTKVSDEYKEEGSDFEDWLNDMLRSGVYEIVEAKVNGIFDKKDVKSYIRDIGEVVARTVQQTAKNVNIEIPTKGTLMNNNSVIQYELTVSRFTGDMIGLGEEIANNLKAKLESGRVKDVKCVPEHKSGNRQVLVLSIIGPDIAKVENKNEAKKKEPIHTKSQEEKVEKLYKAYPDEFDSLSDVWDIADTVNELYDKGGWTEVNTWFLPAADEKYKDMVRDLVLERDNLGQIITDNKKLNEEEVDEEAMNTDFKVGDVVKDYEDGDSAVIEEINDKVNPPKYLLRFVDPIVQGNAYWYNKGRFVKETDEQVIKDVLEIYKNLKSKKTEADNTSGTLSIDLNTGVLPIVDVDMYSMSDMINDFDVTQKELDDIVMETAPEYIEDTLSEILSGVSVIAKSVYHPSQYNYSGDELEFTLNCDKGGYESLKERTLQNESFSKFLKDNYSSHSGFISSMADNLDDFETQEEWKQVVQVIMFNVPQKTLEYNKDAYNDKFMDILSSNYPMIDDEDYDDYVNEDLEESKKMIKENNATEIDENKKIVEDDEVEMIDSDSKGEDMTETQENMEQAVQELGDIDSETEFGIDTIVSTIDVLITDEQSAIDGYNSFLGQCKNTLPDELYNTIKTEIDEIIQDEEDHINKLTVIKETLNTDTAPSENTDFEVDMEDVDTVEENKQLNENSSYNFKYKKGDTVPFKGKNYKVVKVIPAHQWEGQNASDEEGEDNSFVEFTDDMYEIQNPKNSSDWGYVKATELDK